MHIAFDNTYARELTGLYALIKPAGSPAPRLLKLNQSLAAELGLDPSELASVDGLSMLAGNAVPALAQPLAQAYAGHQFGRYSPQLGDGRALLLGELIDRKGQRRDLALKGSGKTLFSRRGDGLAVLGAVLREYLMGEAMHALGIPTTRVLAAVATGATVQRERAMPGAILTRVAASHLRVGTLQFAAAKRDNALLRRLADYVIARHDPALTDEPDKYLQLLQNVVERQALLVARWMGVGFIHGVMNTDNMTISGETIDYGPCAFMEQFDPKTVFSSIDTEGRYAYGNQPAMAQWNLARLAEALSPLIDTDGERAAERGSAAAQHFAQRFDVHWTGVLCAKTGLSDSHGSDRALADEYLKLLQEHRIDFTLGFRRLTDASIDGDEPLLALFGGAAPALQPWLQRWRLRAPVSGEAERAATMRRVNPIYIPRNHQVEAALTAAVDHDDLAPFERLLAVLEHPFEEREPDASFTHPATADETAGYQTFCGT